MQLYSARLTIDASLEHFDKVQQEKHNAVVDKRRVSVNNKASSSATTPVSDGCGISTRPTIESGDAQDTFRVDSLVVEKSADNKDKKMQTLKNNVDISSADQAVTEHECGETSNKVEKCLDHSLQVGVLLCDVNGVEDKNIPLEKNITDTVNQLETETELPKMLEDIIRGETAQALLNLSSELRSFKSDSSYISVNITKDETHIDITPILSATEDHKKVDRNTSLVTKEEELSQELATSVANAASDKESLEDRAARILLRRRTESSELADDEPDDEAIDETTTADEEDDDVDDEDIDEEEDEGEVDLDANASEDEREGDEISNDTLDEEENDDDEINSDETVEHDETSVATTADTDKDEDNPVNDAVGNVVHDKDLHPDVPMDLEMLNQHIREACQDAGRAAWPETDQLEEHEDGNGERYEVHEEDMNEDCNINNDEVIINDDNSTSDNDDEEVNRHSDLNNCVHDEDVTLESLSGKMNVEEYQDQEMELVVENPTMYEGTDSNGTVDMEEYIDKLETTETNEMEIDKDENVIDEDHDNIIEKEIGTPMLSSTLTFVAKEPVESATSIKNQCKHEEAGQLSSSTQVHVNDSHLEQVELEVIDSKISPKIVSQHHSNVITCSNGVGVETPEDKKCLTTINHSVPLGLEVHSPLIAKNESSNINTDSITDSYKKNAFTTLATEVESKNQASYGDQVETSGKKTEIHTAVERDDGTEREDEDKTDTCDEDKTESATDVATDFDEDFERRLGRPRGRGRGRRRRLIRNTHDTMARLTDPSTINRSPCRGRRGKRGLERELQQLDYWGRRTDGSSHCSSKRRRRPGHDGITAAHLLRSFVPAVLLG